LNAGSEELFLADEVASGDSSLLSCSLTDIITFNTQKIKKPRAGYPAVDIFINLESIN